MDLTGVLAVTFIFGGATTVFLAMSPVGRAIADRIRGPNPASGDRVRVLEEQVEALIDEVEVIRGEFADVQERLDFTERLMARESKPRLPAPENVQD